MRVELGSRQFMTNHQPRSYKMHPSVEKAFNLVHDWFRSDPELCKYDQFDRSDSSRVLKRENLVDAAFNFNYYFPTHFFKACHTLQAEEIIGSGKLGAWMRYNPYLSIIDIGCGDGAGDQTRTPKSRHRSCSRAWRLPRSQARSDQEGR